MSFLLAAHAYPPPTRPQTTAGALINLASADVERFQLGGLFCNFLWFAPLETLVILYFGLSLVGVSFLAGFVALAFMLPMQVCGGGPMGAWRDKYLCMV